MSLKEIYIESLKSHDWNYERHVDSKFDIGVKQKDKIRSIIAEAYESADYGIRTPWEELLLDQEIQKEENQKRFNDVKY